MLRVKNVDVAWPTGNQVANVVKDSIARAITKTRLATPGARPMCEVTAPLNDLGFGQIVGVRDAFRDVRQILSGGHSKALLGQLVWPRNLQDSLA